MSTTIEETAVAVKKRGRGRPRSTGTNVDDPRAEIVRVATRMFREKGYNETSFSAVAKEAGLSQSSMYYWFKSKEELLDEVLTGSFRNCTYKGKLFSANAPIEVRLFALLYRRTFKYCNLPVDVYDIEAAACSNSACFKLFFEEFEEYRSGLTSLLEEGLEQGCFSGISAVDAFCLLMSMILTQQHLYHQYSVSADPFVIANKDFNPEEINQWALRAARMGLGAMVADQDLLASAEQSAREYGWLFDD